MQRDDASLLRPRLPCIRGTWSSTCAMRPPPPRPQKPVDGHPRFPKLQMAHHPHPSLTPKSRPPRRRNRSRNRSPPALRPRPTNATCTRRSAVVVARAYSSSPLSGDNSSPAIVEHVDSEEEEDATMQVDSSLESNESSESNARLDAALREAATHAGTQKLDLDDVDDDIRGRLPSKSCTIID